MVRRAGACVALLGFAGSLLVGAWVGNPAVVVMRRALWSMLICFAVGLLAGWVAEKIVRERVGRYEKELFDSLVPPPPSAEPGERATEDVAVAAPIRAGQAEA